ncbi:MAG TPA: peptidylprolyl isomerase [bacterium]
MHWHLERIAIILLSVTVFWAVSIAQVKSSHPQVVLETSMGRIVLELDAKKAPVSVENFLSYVRSGFYDGTVFHRVIPRFMIQGGGYEKSLQEKQTKAPIVNEAGNGLKNLRGTLAYARTPVVNSATSQFFINQVDNAFLDHKDNSDSGYGYAVFGKVVKGLDVVDKISKVSTGAAQNGMADVPLTPVVILSARILK